MKYWVALLSWLQTDMKKSFWPSFSFWIRTWFIFPNCLKGLAQSVVKYRHVFCHKSIWTQRNKDVLLSNGLMLWFTILKYNIVFSKSNWKSNCMTKPGKIYVHQLCFKILDTMWKYFEMIHVYLEHINYYSRFFYSKTSLC